jgi:hypothetical protein
LKLLRLTLKGHLCYTSDDKFSHRDILLKRPSVFVPST